LDLTIYVRNVNDYEPQFIVNEISVNFTEHSDPGSERIKLPDTIDKDQLELDDPNDTPSQVCYFIVSGNEAGYFRLDPESHILTVDRELDREVMANFTLYVRATENCGNDSLTGGGKRRRMGIEINNRLGGFLHNQQIGYDRFKHSRQLRSPETNEYEAEDGEMASYETYDSSQEDQSGGPAPTHPESDSTVVKVKVRVLDINDNPPRFRSKIFTGGITTSADFGLKFMRVEATDADEGENGKIGYYQVGEIRQTLSEGLENVRKAPFLLDQETGEVQLNFDPQKGMKGYFDFVVLANDTSGMKDVAHVFIYLLREDQKVRFVFRLQPDELRSRVDSFRE